MPASAVTAPHAGPAASAPRTRTPAARALWAGPGALRALATARTGGVELAFARGGYVRLEGRPTDWLHVVAPRAPRGPLTLVVAGLDRAPLAAGAPVHAGADELTIGALRIALAGAPGDLAAASAGATPGERARGAAAPGAGTARGQRAGLAAAPSAAAVAPARPACRPGRLGALASALAAVAPPPAELRGGLEALRRGELAAAVAELAGRGAGLTPAGDDVLAGFAAWSRHAGSPSALAAAAAGRCSPLGLAYLRCAERGELPEPAARAIYAIRDGDASLARMRARALSAWGASSGAAILWGIAAAAAGAHA